MCEDQTMKPGEEKEGCGETMNPGYRSAIVPWYGMSQNYGSTLSSSPSFKLHLLFIYFCALVAVFQSLAYSTVTETQSATCFTATLSSESMSCFPYRRDNVSHICGPFIIEQRVIIEAHALNLIP